MHGSVMRCAARFGATFALVASVGAGQGLGAWAATPVRTARADAGVTRGSGPKRCAHPSPPAWFHDSLVTAISISGDLQPGWADAPQIASIACWQGTRFDAGFHAHGDAYHDWHGIFAMAVEEMQTIEGPWNIDNRYGFVLTPKCFVWGWQKCSRTPENSRTTQQEIAALRWIWLNLGDPATAWRYVERTGRFDSYPRPGTDDTATDTPLALCPVAGIVNYADDFGQPRYVGGYHPHWGNDMLAPRDREIRAPFDGLAVGRTDDWLGGNSVTVVGAKGYVRNAHLDHFGTLGYVTSGTVIGYVGDTGDAGITHDHFEWHPWVVPSPLHQAPSGFSRVNDAIDPFPFLNQVCTT